jgi:uncharacterized membrane protein
MPSVFAEISVPRPPSAVYAAAKDLEGLKPYLKDVETLNLLSLEGNVSRSEWVAAAMGKKIRWIEEEVWDDTGLRNTFSSPEGDFDLYQGSWSFLPEDGGTKVRLDLEYELNIPLFGGLLQKLILKLMQENSQSLLAGLKERCLAG